MVHHTPAQIFFCDPGLGGHQSLELDAFEQSFLCVARHFFETHDAPDSQCWMQAFLEAETRFPPPFGATIAHAISIVVSALGTRQGTFAYYKTGHVLADHAITREEQYLIKALRDMRTGNRTNVQTAALLLCCGADTRPFLAAMERLCLIIGDVSELQFQ